MADYKVIRYPRPLRAHVHEIRWSIRSRPGHYVLIPLTKNDYLRGHRHAAEVCVAEPRSNGREFEYHLRGWDKSDL